MAGLEIAASVVGVAAVGMQIAKGLVEIAERIKNAGEEVRLCASDTALFSQMVGNLADALKLPTASLRPIQSTTEDLFDVCEMILEPFQRLIAKLKPLLEKYRESEHQLKQIGLYIQWQFRNRSKVTFYQQALQQIKPTLTCLLATMNLQEAKIGAPQNLFICQMQVENSRASIDHQARADRAALLEPTSDLQTDWQLFLSGADLEAFLHSAEKEGEQSVENEDESSVREALDKADFRAINGDIDNDPSHDTAIAVRIDLLSLQRKVLKIAANVLKSTTTSMTMDALSISPLEQEIPTRKDISPENSSPRHSFSMADDWPLQTGIAITRAPSTSPAHGSPPKDVSSGDSSPHQKSSTPENWPHTPSRRTSRTIPVTLTDPLGERTALPFEACSTWATMQNTITDLLSTRPSLEEDIASHNYTLCFNNDALIPVQHWESLIAPGARITLRTAHGPPPLKPSRPAATDKTTYVPSGAINGQSPRPSRVRGSDLFHKSRVSLQGGGKSTEQVDKMDLSRPGPFRRSRVSIVGDSTTIAASKGHDDPPPPPTKELEDHSQGREEEKVRIVDSAGGIYEVPFSLCRSFSTFEKALRKKIYPVDHPTSKPYYDFFSEYSSSSNNNITRSKSEAQAQADTNTQAVNYAYTLKPHVFRTENGTRIPPPKWKEAIQPGGTVRVSFLDQGLAGRVRGVVAADAAAAPYAGAGGSDGGGGERAKGKGVGKGRGKRRSWLGGSK